MVGAVFNPVLRALSVENLQAFKDGHEIPNIITGQFQDMFATFGGAGSTLSLIIVMVLFCKVNELKAFATFTNSWCFGINEPIILGYQLF